MSIVSFVKKHRVFIGLFMITAMFFIGASVHAAPVLESGIPGVREGGAQGAKIPDLPTYINYLYIFVLGFVGIAGFISLVIWGTVWVGSAVVDKKAMAMERIKSVFIGMSIALTAYIMLITINPDLITIKIPKLGTLTAPATSLCYQYSVTTCPITQGCMTTPTGCADDPAQASSTQGACLKNKVIWESGTTNSQNPQNLNLATSNCYSSCTDNTTLSDCNSSATTTAFVLGSKAFSSGNKDCLYLKVVGADKNCSTNNYNANAY